MVAERRPARDDERVGEQRLAARRFAAREGGLAESRARERLGRKRADLAAHAHGFGEPLVGLRQARGDERELAEKGGGEDLRAPRAGAHRIGVQALGDRADAVVRVAAGEDELRDAEVAVEQGVGEIGRAQRGIEAELERLLPGAGAVGDHRLDLDGLPRLAREAAGDRQRLGLGRRAARPLDVAAKPRRGGLSEQVRGSLVIGRRRERVQRGLRGARVA